MSHRQQKFLNRMLWHSPQIASFLVILDAIWLFSGDMSPSRVEAFFVFFLLLSIAFMFIRFDSLEIE